MSKDDLRRTLFIAFACMFALTLATPANANVYASNIRLNGGVTNTAIQVGESVAISYVLNEPASRGVTLRLVAGGTAVRTFTLTAGGPGTLRGTNTVTWDGRTDTGNAAPSGAYWVSITASSSGYADWTQISDDSSLGNYVWEGKGIGINRDANSPYYGRVYVANAAPGPGSKPGDQPGILMLNADGSAADEGIFSTGGHTWAGDTFSPWHLEVSDDGLVYINDWTGNGEVYRWDPLLTPTNSVHVLRPDNWGNGGFVSLSGPAVSGPSTNRVLWMADARESGLGLIRYNITNSDGAIAVGDTGTTVVSNTPALSLVPFDVATDRDSNLYTIQYVAGGDDPTPRVLRFSAADPSTPSWAIGGQDPTMGRATGIAVDPTGTFVAVAFQGIDDPIQSPQWTNGCTQIFYATNGARVTHLDLGKPNGAGNEWHQDADCAWDALGNVYAIDILQTRWRTFSPPGQNESTTVSVPTIEVAGSGTVEPPRITKVEVNGGMVIVTFTGLASDPPSAYVLLGAAAPNGPFLPETNYTIEAGAAAGEFRATLPSSGTIRFYRVAKTGAPVETVLITAITVTNGTATIDFTGSPSTPASAYKILAAVDLTGPFLPAVDYTITAGGTPGTFRATVPAIGSFRFFRVVKSTSSTQAPTIKSLELAGGAVTVKFSGNASDSASAYTLVGASTPQGPFAAEAGSAITAGTPPGDFIATAPATGPLRFYRVLK